MVTRRHSKANWSKCGSSYQSAQPIKSWWQCRYLVRNTCWEDISILKRLFAQRSEHVHAKPIKSWFDCRYFLTSRKEACSQEVFEMSLHEDFMSMFLSVFVSTCVSPCASVASSSLDSVSSVTWPGVCAGLVMAANKWKWKTHLHFQCTFPQFHSLSR